MQIFPWSWKQNFLYWQQPNNLSLRYNTVKIIFSSHFSCSSYPKILTMQTNTRITCTKTSPWTLILFNVRGPLGLDWVGDVCGCCLPPQSQHPCVVLPYSPLPLLPVLTERSSSLSASLSPLLQWTTAANQDFTNADWEPETPANTWSHQPSPAPCTSDIPRAAGFLQHVCDSRALGVSRDLCARCCTNSINPGFTEKATRTWSGHSLPPEQRKGK